MASKRRAQNRRPERAITSWNVRTTFSKVHKLIREGAGNTNDTPAIESESATAHAKGTHFQAEEHNSRTFVRRAAEVFYQVNKLLDLVQVLGETIVEHLLKRGNACCKVVHIVPNTDLAQQRLGSD